MGAMVKKLQIGQRPASRICQMSSIDRLAFVTRAGASNCRELPLFSLAADEEAEATARAFPPTHR